MVILTYILLILLMVLIGSVSYYMAVSFMRMMAFGSIFWKFRFYKFLKYANGFHIAIASDILNQDLSSKDMDSLKLNQESPFIEKNDALMKLYWEVVSYKSDFKLWLCAECMAYRIAIFYSILCLAWFVYSGYISWYGGFFFFFFGLSFISSSITINAQHNE